MVHQSDDDVPVVDIGNYLGTLIQSVSWGETQ